MPQYQRSLTMDADPDELFDFLSKVENLPKYFSRLSEAHPVTGDDVHVTAVLPADPDHPDSGPGTQTVESDATFSVDADGRSISWGSENEHDYHGELQVTPVDEGARVSVTLHTEHESESINDGIDETLQNVAELVVSSPDLEA